MKKYIFFIIILMILISPGCKKNISIYKDLENVAMVKLAGIDKELNKVKLTSVVQALKGSESNESTGNKVISKLMFSEGATIFDAKSNLNTFSEKYPLEGRIDQIIIGDQASRNGIREMIDFFTRSGSARLSTKVYVSKNTSAQNIISEVANKEAFMGDILNLLDKNRGSMSVSSSVTLNDLVSMLDSKTSSPYLPCLETISAEQTGKDEITSSFQLIGLAIFKDDKLLYYLNGEETRAFNWIIGDVSSGIIIVKDPIGEYVSLEIISSDKKIKSSINNAKPKIDVVINMSSNIGEQQSTLDITNTKSLNFLKAQQEEIIKTSVENVIKKAQEMNTDIFGFGDILYHQHPNEWEKIKNDWNNIFPTLEVTVTVSSQINRTYIISIPNGFYKNNKIEKE